MKSCFFYIKSSDIPSNPQQIRKALAEGSIQQKLKMLKQFIKCLVNDDTYPSMIMVIITNIIPLVTKHPQLRKVLLLYWQIIQKSKSVNDPTLKDQMFLACNSLRSDLLSHNQYLRGRTLRLVSRIMHKGVIQPLSTAITQNINHKSAYVRRNAVVCLYNIFMNFGSDIIGDIDEQIQKLLKTQTDLSTKRNAFILLNKSNPSKAMQYLQAQINSESLQDIGDILQLAILKILKQKSRQEPTNKAKFLKIINTFSYKASQAVLLQCSITSLAISNSVLSIKTSLSSYVNILSRTNQLNVKKIVLDKLQIACKNSNYIQQSLVQDLIKNLQTPSYEIKIKILNIISMNLTLKISRNLLNEIKKQITQCNDINYLYKILKTLQNISNKFTILHQDIFHFIFYKIFKIQHLTSTSAQILGRIFITIIEKSNQQDQYKFKCKIVQNFKYIHSKQIIKQILNIYGNFFYQQSQIEMAIDGLRLVIGSLPLTIDQIKQQGQPKDNQIPRPQVNFKTKILEDGSYQTSMVGKIQKQDDNNDKIEQAYFRKLLIQDSIIGGIFTRNMAKMLYKLRQTTQFPKNACSILMILCSLLRNYQQHLYQIDQTIIDLISTVIKKIINPDQFIKNTDLSLQSNKIYLNQFQDQQSQNDNHILQKNPSDLIFFRQLKKGVEQQQQFDDQEVNEILTEKKQKQNFVDKLKSMVQLTGHFDPIYGQAFVTVSKNDVFFQIFLINTTKTNMLNVQIEFASTTQILVLQKAQSVNLKPLQSVSLRTQIRFITGQFGSIYGYINYDNHAGIQQAYLITQQIKIDFIQFILPAKITQSQFKLKWAQYDVNQVKCQAAIKNTINQKNDQIMNISQQQIVNFIQTSLHCLRVQDHYFIQLTMQQQQNKQDFLSKSFYGKSKLGQDFLIIATMFKDTNLDISFTIRSKQYAIAQMIARKITQIDFKIIVNQNKNQDKISKQQINKSQQ